ncbi:hypothetical protein FACS189451_00970 [Bacteroidia bacterium]|nr:hypothetical protein FACS189446_2870 [Bacteroidia bacterium]GHT60608.1 hypothetical protein FACS189451_00970 [Bacteroidia bacterium]
MTKTQEKESMKEKVAERKQLYLEMQNTMLKRANLTKKDILESSLKVWVNENLDLLSKSEIQKYEPLFL